MVKNDMDFNRAADEGTLIWQCSRFEFESSEFESSEFESSEFESSKLESSEFESPEFQSFKLESSEFELSEIEPMLTDLCRSAMRGWCGCRGNMGVRVTSRL